MPNGRQPINLGKFHHDLTVLPSPGDHGLDIGESSPKWPQLIQVGEIL